MPPLAVALVAAAVVSLAVSSMGRAGAWLLLAVVVGLLILASGGTLRQ
jgi:hypothetical protein